MDWPTERTISSVHAARCSKLHFPVWEHGLDLKLAAECFNVSPHRAHTHARANAVCGCVADGFKEVECGLRQRVMQAQPLEQIQLLPEQDSQLPGAFQSLG